MSIEMVARRYAVALADVVLKNGQTETVKAELKDWETMIAANEELKSVFENPALTHESKERILNRLLERSRPSATTANVAAFRIWRRKSLLAA